MFRINARVLLKHTTAQLWEFLQGDFICVFDDTEVVTNYKEVIFSSYTWEYHRLYPDTPMLASHHVRAVIGQKKLNNSTHLKLIANCLWSTYDIYKERVNDKVKLLDDLAKLAYEVTNVIYNDLTYKLEEYVTSIDVLDFLEVIDHPTHVANMKKVLPTTESIAECYSDIRKMINDPVVLTKNPLIKAIQAMIVDTGQVIQCIGPRGFLTDIDSHIFKKPVMRGYMQGIRSMHDIIVESRSAAKALAFSTDPLQQSEYFSRRQQLVCQNVKHVHAGDCGSTNYLAWHVRGDKYEGDIKVSSNDLNTINGKYYLDESTNTLKVIKKTDTHLLNTTIKIRSVVAGCSHPDPYGFCEVCFGEAYLAVPADTNIGHMACTSMTEKLSQNVLSTKHLDGSSVVEGIVLKPHEKKYLSAPINGNVYFLSEDLKNKNVKLVINASSAITLTDVNLVPNVETLSVSRVSEINEIGLLVSDLKGEEFVSIVVCVNKRLANLTHPMLKHIKENGWTITKEGKYIIDMDGWDFKQPMLSLPMRHFNTGDHASEIADMLEATVKDLTFRDSVITPSAMLIEFHDLVNRRITVSLSVLEVVVYGSMVVSATNGDYSLPKTWTDSGVGVMRMLLNNRSMAPAMAYERHKESICAPASYVSTNRLDHVFDASILPLEVLG
jgi:hypothetical protein